MWWRWSCCCLCQMTTTLLCLLWSFPRMENTSWLPHWISECYFAADVLQFSMVSTSRWQYNCRISSQLQFCLNRKYMKWLKDCFLFCGFFFSLFWCCRCSTLKLWDYSKGKVSFDGFNFKYASFILKYRLYLGGRLLERVFIFARS